MDDQLPPALDRFIQSEFKSRATQVADVGLRDASHAEIWRYASSSDYVLISKDEDFAGMVVQVPAAKLIWVRIGNCRRAFRLDVFRRMWQRILERPEIGDRFIEVR